MTVLTSATVPVAQIRRELEYLIERGERAKSTLTAINLLFPAAEGPPESATGHPYGNGEPDAELAKAAGIDMSRGRARPDKWRKFLALRRNGQPFAAAYARLGLSINTAKRLEALV